VIRVLLAEDQAMVRGALAGLLSLEPDIEVVSQVARGDEVLAAALDTRPDVALLDIEMPGIDGIEAAGQLGAELPECKVLILTTFGRPGYLRRAMEQGAAGFLLKDAPRERLLEAIRVVDGGEALLSPSITRRLIEDFAARTDPLEPPAAVLEQLTPREREVLVLVARGLSNGEIAKRLVVTEATVKSHVGRILMKLDLRDRVQAVVFAYEHGIVAAGDPG
jgi:DNA-binding NarL/FixJ family response regulator